MRNRRELEVDMEVAETLINQIDDLIEDQYKNIAKLKEEQRKQSAKKQELQKELFRLLRSDQ